MHALTRHDYRRRLIIAHAGDLFDPDVVTSSSLPVVLFDPSDGTRFEDDVRSLDSFDLFPTLVLLDIAIEEGIGDPAFWNRLGDLLLDRTITTWYNLRFQEGFIDNPAAMEEAVEQVTALYRFAHIEPEDDLHELLFLNVATEKVLNSLLDENSEYVSYCYAAIFEDAMNYLKTVLRVSCLWHLPPPDIDIEEAQTQERYAEVGDRNTKAWAKYGVDDTCAITRQNPYKGGGFSCIN